MNRKEAAVERKEQPAKSRSLGAELREIRNRAGMLLREAAQQIGVHEATLSKIERGLGAIDSEDVATLLQFYGVPVGDERDRLISMARTPNEPSWIQNVGPISKESVTLAGYEAEAVALTNWSLLVPGMCQTMDYTRAFMAADGYTDKEIAPVLLARKQRQERLADIRYTAFIDEFALHRQVGSPDTMAKQLRHLARMMGQHDIRIVPGDAPAHAGLLAAFLVIEFEVASPMVVVEMARQTAFHNGGDDVAHYRWIMDRLASSALDAAHSARLTSEVASQWEGRVNS